MQTQREIPETMSVNDAIRQFPATVAVFNRFGIDACCGGTASIREAARRDGADLDAVLAALEQTAREAS